MESETFISCEDGEMKWACKDWMIEMIEADEKYHKKRVADIMREIEASQKRIEALL